MTETRVRLLNTTDNVLRLRYNGQSIVFQPHGMPGSVHALPPNAAAYVKGQLLDQVEQIAESAAVSYVDHKKVERYYLANFSGDPDSLEFFETEYRGNDGNIHKRKVRNEIHTPQVYRTRLGRESKIVDAGAHTYIDQQTGKPMKNRRPMQVTYPGKMISIPPFTVVEVTKGQYDTILNSEHFRPLDYPRFIRASRPPSDFEPDYNDSKWTLDRLRSYLEMLPETNEREAGAAVIGPSEAELRKDLLAAGTDEESIELIIEKTRFEMYARCKIRAMDLNFVLPTKSDFETHYARKAKAEKSKAA